MQLAETYVRHDGKLTPMDWATAAGSSLSQVVANEFGAQFSAARTTEGGLLNGSLRLGTQLLVAGALRHYDKDAAQSYFENSVGQEVGTFIGDYIGRTVKPYLPEAPRFNAVRDQFGGSSGNATLIGGAGDDRLNNVLIYERRDQNGEYVDQYGNPAPKLYASLDTGTMTDVPLVDQKFEDAQGVTDVNYMLGYDRDPGETTPYPAPPPAPLAPPAPAPAPTGPVAPLNTPEQRFVDAQGVDDVNYMLGYGDPTATSAYPAPNADPLSGRTIVINNTPYSERDVLVLAREAQAVILPRSRSLTKRAAFFAVMASVPGRWGPKKV